VNSIKKTARIAGFMFIFYIATGIASMVIFRQATSGAEETAAKLASIAQHAPLMHMTSLLSLLTFFVAVMLAVALYMLTHNQNPYIAITALCCRAAEGMINAFSAICTLGLLSVATASTVTTAPDSAAAQALGGLLLKQDGSSFLVSGTCFAVGSTLYSYLFLRAKSIPTLIAWFGLFSSLVLVVELPLQIMGFVGGPLTTYIWIPILVFEVTLGLWLLIKGVTIQVTQ
jgi:hypothetical protein